jgi:signal peptidase
MRKILKAATGVVLWALLAMLLLFTVLLVMSTLNLGVRAFVISSGSMSPAIPTGSLVFVRSAGEYREGDVITFSSNNGGYITHRVYEVREEAGRAVYVTKGDANDEPDVNLVEEERVKGRIVFHIPAIGYVTNFFRTLPGAILLLLCIFGSLIYLFTGGRRPGSEAES